MIAYLSGCQADFTNANSASIIFLWQNWHIYFRFHRLLIECKQISKNSWEAGWVSILGRGEWHLTQQDCRPDSGILHFHNYVYFLGRLNKVQTIFQYHCLPDGRIWYCGGGYGELDRLTSLFARAAQALSTILLWNIGRQGGVIADRITSNPGLVEKRCGKEAKALYDAYARELASRLPGGRYFCRRELMAITLYEGRYDFVNTSGFTEAEAKLTKLLEAPTVDWDFTLLRIAQKSLILGLPGASLVALRDLFSQNRAEPQFAEADKKLLRRIRWFKISAGGFMRVHRSEKHVHESDLKRLILGLDLLHELINNDATKCGEQRVGL